MQKKINVLRLIFYSFILFVSALSFWFFRTAFYLICVLLLVIFLILDEVNLRRLVAKTVFSVDNGVDSILIGENTDCYLQIYNPDYSLSLKAQLTLSIQNSFYGDRGEMKLTLPIRMKGKERYKIPLSLTRCGLVTVSISAVKIQDPLGLYERTILYKDVEISNHMECSFTVLPKPENQSIMKEIIKNSTLGYSENEETNVKGNDFSEVSGLREYIPGDRIKDIHWKISAKKGIKMVKERINLSDEQLICVLDFSREPEKTELILQMTYSLIKVLPNGLGAKFIWWDDNSMEFESINYDDDTGVEQIFYHMFKSRVSDQQENIKSLVGVFYKNIPSYLFLTVAATGPKVESVYNTY